MPETMQSVQNTDQAYYSLRAEAKQPTMPIHTVGTNALKININLSINITYINLG